MTDADMLEIVVERTGHAVLRRQVEANPAYWKVVRSLYVVYRDRPAAKRKAAVRTQHFENRTLRTCLYIDRHCGCDLPTCHAGYGDHDDGKKASREHCLACLRTTWGLI